MFYFIFRIHWKNEPAPKNQPYKPTPIEHSANIITHGFWVIPVTWHSYCLVISATSPMQKWAAYIYASVLIGLFSVSTLFHIFACFGKYRCDLFQPNLQVAIWIRINFPLQLYKRPFTSRWSCNDISVHSWFLYALADLEVLPARWMVFATQLVHLGPCISRHFISATLSWAVQMVRNDHLCHRGLSSGLGSLGNGKSKSNIFQHCQTHNPVVIYLLSCFKKCIKCLLIYG